MYAYCNRVCDKYMYMYVSLAYLCFLCSKEAPLFPPLSADAFALPIAAAFLAFFCLASSRWFPPVGSISFKCVSNTLSMLGAESLIVESIHLQKLHVYVKQYVYMEALVDGLIL